MTECNYPQCDREVGTQDRDDYNTRKYCSIQHETKWEHVKADAKEAKRDEEREVKRSMNVVVEYGP